MEILRFPGLGWELPISRVALSIGNLDIYWYGVIIAVGFGLGLWVYLSHNRTCGIHPDEGLDIILWPWSAPLWARGPIMWHSSGIIIKII